MSKYINKRQLAFLVFILAAIFLIRQMQDDPKFTSTTTIPSSTDKAFRSNPATYTAHTACLKRCLDLSDSSISLVLKYGVIKEAGETIVLEGNALSGVNLALSFQPKTKENLITDLQKKDAETCNCP